MAENKNISNEKVNLQYLINDPEDNETIDIKSIVERFLKNWWFFAVSIAVTLSIAYLINKITHPKYNVSTSLVINEEASMSDAPSDLMSEIGFFTSDKNFINETFLLKTSPLIQSALDKLEFRISYFQKTRFGQHELYKSTPFVVLLNQQHPQPVGCKIFIKIIDEKKYTLIINKKEMQVFSFVSNQTTQIIGEYKTEIEAKFNEYSSNNYYDFKIMLNSEIDIKELRGQEFYFTINTDKDLIKEFKNKMEITPPDLESTIAEISINSTVPLKAVDFLNSLTESYIVKDFQQKLAISKKTIEYIDKQLDKVSESLNLAEDDLQEFRSKKKVLDVSMQSTQIFEELNTLKRDKATLDVTLKYVEYIQEYFKKNTVYTDLISPASMGIQDPTLNSLVEELINLNIEKVSFIDNNQEKNPYLQKINIRINNLRSMISENIEYIRQTTNIALEDADSRINQLNNEIQKMPETERELLGIERIFDINNNIYTYLLEKKSEAEIAKASYQSNIEIAEPADIVGSGPISPKKNRNYIIAFIIGFIVPTGFIYIKNILKTSFYNIEEIKEASPFPIIGEIYHNNEKLENVVERHPDSQITESFRKLNINLKYFLNGTSSKTIALTSTVSGEGKSFIALNLAHILALNNLNTVLVGFDIRRPKQFISLTQKTKNIIGVSDYISNQANMEDIIHKTNNEYLDIVPAGKVPPNPAELLTSNKTDELLNFLKENYDYVIIDTPPIGIVIDAYTLMDKSDLNVFVSRIKYTPINEFKKIVEELKNKKMINGMVINDVEANRKSKYGYGYYKIKQENKSTMFKFKRKKR